MNASPQPLVVHGWSIYAHPLFLDQLEALAAQVENLRNKHPLEYHKKAATKRLAAISKLAFEIIPQGPQRPEYRQGGTLGSHRKHWLRAKFYQQYRLFFRYHHQKRIIVYAWVNDEQTKRAYDSENDAYKVFQKMLDKGSPPEDWEILLAQSKAQSGKL